MKIFFNFFAFFVCVLVANALQAFIVVNRSDYDIQVSIFEDNDSLRYKKWIYPERFEIRWIDDSKRSDVNNVERGNYSVILKHGQIAKIDMSADIDYCHVHLSASRNRNGQAVKKEEWWLAETYCVLPNDVITLCPWLKKNYEILK